MPFGFLDNRKIFELSGDFFFFGNQSLRSSCKEIDFKQYFIHPYSFIPYILGIQHILQT